MMYRTGWGPVGGGYDGGWWLGHFPVLMALFAPIIILLVVWTVFWKGLALWHSARRGQPWWFVIMLVVNTLGILEIIYLFGIAKLRFGELFSYKDHGHTH